MNNLVDVHAHLDFPQFDSDRKRIIEKCREKLKAVVNSGTSLEGNFKTLKLAQENPRFIFPTLGLHPTYIEKTSLEDIENVKSIIKENRDIILGIGEIGLDYFHTKDKVVREKHKKIFIEFLNLAEKLRLPVIIHSRDAEKHALEILENYKLKGIMHCFNGTVELMRKAQNLGFFISISTQVLYSKRVQEIVKEMNLKHMLLETDSPFLGGQERNYPWNIYQSLYKVSEIRDIEVEKLGRIINKNVENIFPKISERNV